VELNLLDRGRSDGIDRCHPSPNGPFPGPELYERDSLGKKSERPGDENMGTVGEPVPVTGLTENFSPMPRIAPPPFGRLIVGE
jgi:hypothetical protein